jgi:predicted dehydrogenase
VSRPLDLAIAGAGLVGTRHAEAITAASYDIRLSAIVDPAEAGKVLADRFGVSHFTSLDSLLSGAEKPDGIILATPNQHHLEGGLLCVAAGVPVLVEKPLATESTAGKQLVDAAAAAGVHLLTGHHRRHNPLIRGAKEEIEAGSIGEIVSVNAMTWFYKPDGYFDVEWRRKPGGGPVFINLIHDIDILHYLCGSIESVFAFESKKIRGNPVEDSCAINLRFTSGALGTVNVSDTIVAPWSWELTAAENPAYPATSEFCYLIGGTHGALELPALRLWRNHASRDWHEPIDTESIPFDSDEPLALQIRQFAAVIRGEAEPLVSGRDGLEALRVVEAIKTSATTGKTVTLAPASEIPAGVVR